MQQRNYTQTSWRLSWVWLGLAVLGCQQSVPGKPAPAEPARNMIDSHVHITPSPDCLQRALAAFARNRVTKFCTKNARFPGSRMYAATLAVHKKLGDRFAFFTNLDWHGVDEPGWGQREAARLEKAVRDGASGVKIFKALGLGVRTEKGALLTHDDPRLDPSMEKAAQLGAVVAMHTGDPKVFFDPPGPGNDRYIELLFAPSWSFYGKDFPSREDLFKARQRLWDRHPNTTFLGIHLGNNPESLDEVDAWLTRYPNLYVDVSARLGEIGRHPAAEVRAFFIKHQDRILFGTDLIVSPDGYQLGSLAIWPDDESDVDRFYQAHREYFETSHQGISHPTPIQGYWTVDAIDLPEDVLEKFYVTNAEKLIFSRKKR